VVRRSWSNSSLDRGLPAPTTPTTASSTYFSGGPSAGTGPAAQSPFRARNVRGNTSARYAATSLIPTKSGTGSGSSFPSAGKPPLAPVPGVRHPLASFLHVRVGEGRSPHVSHFGGQWSLKDAAMCMRFRTPCSKRTCMWAGHGLIDLKGHQDRWKRQGN
jgi:hypothetical protein